MISFASPWYLLLLLLLPLVWYLYKQTLEKKRKVSLTFSNMGLVKRSITPSKFSWRKHIIFILQFAMLLLLVLALSDLHVPWKQAKDGVNVVLAIDVSGSMQAQDYTPNRMESAKRNAALLVEQLEPQDHVGIVIFESGATTAAYLSPFKERVLDKLSTIQVKQGRTAIGDGLSLAVDMAASIPNKKKIVILLSDGVSNDGVISPNEAIVFAQSNKIRVFTIGMGSEEPVVLGHDFFGRPQYAELDEGTLKHIAEKTGGTYYKSVDDETLADIYSGLTEKIDREWEDTSTRMFLFVVIGILLCIQLYIVYGKYRIIQ